MPLETLQQGRYRVLRPLGSGSMGEVYLVDDTRINRQVAIKVIRTEAVPYSGSSIGSQEASRLFEREAKAIARLNHPNILPLFDFGEEKVNGTLLAYMVMPYCPDGSLATWIQQHSENAILPAEDVAHVVRQAADALQHAHDNGIIHQDVKPQNFLLRRTGSRLPDLLLADFGIAKLTLGTSGSSQAIRGTPIYMAPEQWEGNPVPASDQYSLAVMTYQLLTGRPPFEGGPSQMMFQHFNVAPLPLSSVNPALHEDIDAVVLRAMAKKAENRFPTVAAFADAFQKAVVSAGSTIVQPQGVQAEAPIQAALAISNAEAINGTSRTLTLANGRKVRVELPAGVHNNQVIKVQGRDPSGSGAGAVIPMLITVNIAPGDSEYATLPAGGDKALQEEEPTAYLAGGRTVMSGMPTILSHSERPAGNRIMPPPPSDGRTLFYDESVAGSQGPQPPPRRRTPSALIILTIALVILLILGGAGFILYSSYVNSSANNSNATATALANNATATFQSNGTLTAQTATAIAQATNSSLNSSQATATANAQASATVNAQNSADATATAATQNNINANATATAQANANATATATAAHPIISSSSGTIQGTYEFDFDQGQQTSTSEADVFWDQHTSTVRTMDPINGAEIVNLGVVDFNSITFDQLQDESYSTNSIDGNDDSTNQLVNGDVFAVHTTDGNYAKVLVVSYGYNLQIQWVTYHG